MAATLHQHGHSHGLSHGHSHGYSSMDETQEKEHGHSHSQKENINVRAAFIHVIGDLVQSIGVFVAALIIYIRVSQNSISRRFILK